MVSRCLLSVCVQFTLLAFVKPMTVRKAAVIIDIVNIKDGIYAVVIRLTIYKSRASKQVQINFNGHTLLWLAAL